MSAEMVRYRARWIFPGDAPPLENAIVEIQDDLIVSLSDADSPDAVDLGNVALIPGLVNAHTHLEFSELRQPLEPSDSFTDWIRSTVGYRRSLGDHYRQAIREGLTESRLAGSSLLGEIVTADWPTELVIPESPDIVLFREIIGLSPERRREQLQLAKRFLDENPAHQTEKIRKGVSPHAPYSVHPDLYRDIIALAAERLVPVAIHLAETLKERELIESGSGPFVTLLQDFGVWEEEVFPSQPMIDYLRPLAELERALIIHGNYLTAKELRFLADSPQLGIVYCPRTHHYFHHSPHPWRDYQQLGGLVALGTDGRGSNPDLSLWNELLFLQKHASEVPPAERLALGTLNGATALGVDAQQGTISAGKSSRLTAISLPLADNTDPYALLFDKVTSPAPFPPHEMHP